MVRAASDVPTLDLAPDDLARVRRILAAVIPGRRVCAFGSRVTGGARRFSDLDLAILGDGLDWATAARLAEAFSESDLPVRVDIVDYATAGPAFRAIIDRDGVPIS